MNSKRKRTALITAASKGIGFAIAKSFAENGYHVIISSSNPENLGNAFTKLGEIARGSIHKIACNLRDPDQVKELCSFCSSYTEGIDILVNNCGGPSAGYFGEIEEQQWDYAHQEILKSAVALIESCLPAMKEKRHGRILNITSISTRQYVDNLILSSAYRTALTSVAKVLSIQLAQYNITVNNIAPGYTLTDRIKELTEFSASKQGISYKEALANLDKNVPMQRLASPDEIAGLALYLASEMAGYITGNTITIDGGLNRNMF